MPTILISPDAMPGDYFYGARVLLAEENAGGAIGFIINRLFPRQLHELQEFAHLPPFPLYEGGPVDTDHLYFIHCRPDLIADGKEIGEGWYFGGNFPQAVKGIAAGSLTRSGIRIFVGYCGWDAGEIAEEGWEISAGGW